MKPLRRLFKTLALGYLGLCLIVTLAQGKILFFPTHKDSTATARHYGLVRWQIDGVYTGFVRRVSKPRMIWLFLHGNGGQAVDRGYALGSFNSRDAVCFLEYPGYGERGGKPNTKSINAAAKQAYEFLVKKFPNHKIGVVGESLGSGAASLLAQSSQPPVRIVLIVPFDELKKVAAKKFSYLPVRLLMRNNWNNIRALTGYQGRIDIYAARSDRVIPIEHARALAKALPNSNYHEISGGHNDWSLGNKVKISD